MKKLILFLALSSPVFSQQAARFYTVANLPLASLTNGQGALITDGVNATDCTSGGGSFAVICVSNGSFYAPLSLATGSGNVSTTGNLIPGHVPQATGTTTIADGGQVYPSGPFADTISAQAFTNKNLTSNTNTFPTFNQNTTGTAGGLSGSLTQCSGQASIGIGSTGNANCLSIAAILGYTPQNAATSNSNNDALGAAAAAQAAAQAFAQNGSNITSGTIAAARITNPLNQNTTGNAGTASAFDHSPSGCALNFAPNGILSVGNFTGCTEIEPCLNMITYGGSGNGSTSNNAAWNAAIAASVSDQVCLYFPPGTYAFASQPSWTAPHTYSSILVRGDSAEVAQLVFPSAISGLLLQTLANSNSIHVRDLSIRTSGIGNANGLILRNTGGFGANGGAASDITNVAFYGSDCVACTDYWQNALVLDGISVVSMDKVKIVGQPTGGGTTGLGNAVFIESSGGFPAVVFNINSGSEFDYVNQALLIGDWIQGITINQTNMTGVTTGISVPSGETHGLDQLLMTNTQINAEDNAVNIQSPFNHVGFVNDYFIVPGSGNAILNNNTSTTDIANSFFLNIGGGGGNAVVMGTYNAGLSSIIGNTFEGGFTTAIFLQSGSHLVTVGTNTYSSGVTTQVVNSGTGNTVAATCPTGITAGTVVIVNGLPTHC